LSAPRLTLPPGTALSWFESIDSTNEEARRQAAAGARGPLWIVAERQTAGRGRRGRSWESASGNLMATYLFTPKLSPEAAAQLSFAAALSVLDVIDAAAPGLASVKWPNDVLIRGRKVAGILLESETSGQGGLAWLAIGIGINLAHHPEGIPLPATSLAAEGVSSPALGPAVERLAAALSHWIGVHAQSGFAPLREAWLARGPAPGTALRAQSGDETREGFFAGLDEQGALLLADEYGALTKIGAGEVFFAAPGTRR
jgi:BirA family biotin operon repressor/biotin-[acetyl-CoA-carboxylase] ligase